MRTLTVVNSLFGFLLGSVAAGASVYYYVLKEYRVSNELLTEDIYVCFLVFPSLAFMTDCTVCAQWVWEDVKLTETV